MSHIRINYQARLDFIQNLLRDRFNISGAKIIPIQYDPGSPFKYNNFVYHISLPSPIVSDQLSGQNGSLQPGCVSIPCDVTDFILRLSNPDAEGIHQQTRVENEVAMIQLTSAALRDFEPHVVPSVYAWGSAGIKSSQGYILQELMPGTALDTKFDNMDLGEKKQVLAQIARILKSLQEYQIPAGLSFGGLTFDGNGSIISSAMTNVGNGPWPTYQASYKGQLEMALAEADVSYYIEGWRGNGIRERLAAFIECGLPPHFKFLDLSHDRIITHADFNTTNLLYNTTTRRITGLIDYDFSCISHPSCEFFHSFPDFGGRLGGRLDSSGSEESTLRDAKLHGFPSPLPRTTEKKVQWEVAKAWEDELERLNVKRPRTIPGIDKVAEVDTLLRAILPWRLHNQDALQLQSEKVILSFREECGDRLAKILNHLGF